MDVPLETLGVSAVRSMQGANVQLVRDRLRLTAAVPPLSPLVVEINTEP